MLQSVHFVQHNQHHTLSFYSLTCRVASFGLRIACFVMGAGASVARDSCGVWIYVSRVARQTSETLQVGIIARVHEFDIVDASGYSEVVYYISIWMPRTVDIGMYTSLSADTNLTIDWDEIMAISDMELCR